VPAVALLIDEGGEAGFDYGAAAQTPGSANDFSGEELFHGADGTEVLPEGIIEVLIFLGFVGLDAVQLGEEAEGDGVFGGAGFAFGGAGSGGGLGIDAIGGDLSFG
jgi:hypothetical protein